MLVTQQASRTLRTLRARANHCSCPGSHLLRPRLGLAALALVLPTNTPWLLPFPPIPSATGQQVLLLFLPHTASVCPHVCPPTPQLPPLCKPGPLPGSFQASREAPTSPPDPPAGLWVLLLAPVCPRLPFYVSASAQGLPSYWGAQGALFPL